MNRRSAMTFGLGVLFAPRAALARLERRERLLRGFRRMQSGWYGPPEVVDEVIRKCQEISFRHGVCPRVKIKIGREEDV
jgi:hypothetical protein